MPHEKGLHCLIGGADAVPARWESATRVTCETPSTRQVGPVAISLQSNATILKATSTLVLVSRPHVTAVRPSRGPLRGGTTIIVHGANLPTGVTDRCVLGSSFVVPTLRSSTSYTCHTPPWPTAASAQVNSPTSVHPRPPSTFRDLFITWPLMHESMQVRANHDMNVLPCHRPVASLDVDPTPRHA